MFASTGQKCLDPWAAMFASTGQKAGGSVWHPSSAQQSDPVLMDLQLPQLCHDVFFIPKACHTQKLEDLGGFPHALWKILACHVQ